MYEIYTDELMHHGVKGQKWGVRRYQNYDGTLKNRAAQRKEYRADKKKLRDVGDRASYAGYAYSKYAKEAASKRPTYSTKRNVQYTKDAYSDLAKAAKKVQRQRERDYAKQVNAMQKKYGTEKIKNVQYATIKRGKAGENTIVNTHLQARSTAAAAASIGAGLGTFGAVTGTMFASPMTAPVSVMAYLPAFTAGQLAVLKAFGTDKMDKASYDIDEEVFKNASDRGKKLLKDIQVLDAAQNGYARTYR